MLPQSCEAKRASCKLVTVHLLQAGCMGTVGWYPCSTVGWSSWCESGEQPLQSSWSIVLVLVLVLVVVVGRVPVVLFINKMEPLSRPALSASACQRRYGDFRYNSLTSQLRSLRHLFVYTSSSCILTM